MNILKTAINNQWIIPETTPGDWQLWDFQLTTVTAIAFVAPGTPSPGQGHMAGSQDPEAGGGDAKLWEQQD